jgi:hypothetical protein
MRGLQRIKTVPFAHCRQAGSGAWNAASEPRTTQIDLARHLPFAVPAKPSDVIIVAKAAEEPAANACRSAGMAPACAREGR